MRSHRIVRGLIAASLAVAVLSACGDDSDTATPDPSPAASEKCGLSKISELQVTTFCGDGSITVEAGTAAVDLDRAECDVTDEYVGVNAGTFVLAPSSVGQNEAEQLRSAREYASVTVGRYPGSNAAPAATDGSYDDVVVAFNDGRPDNVRVTDASATLREGRSAGDFTGTLPDGTRLSGSFTC